MSLLPQIVLVLDVILAPFAILFFLCRNRDKIRRRDTHFAQRFGILFEVIRASRMMS